MYLRKVVAPEVKIRLSDMYRIESTAETRDNQGASNKMLRQKIKTVLFFIIDFALLALIIFTIIKKYALWTLCKKHFDGWIITVLIFSVLSLFVNFFNFCLLRRIQLNNEDYDGP